MRARAALAAGVALAMVACGGATRFALRPPILRDSDDRPFEKPPRDDEQDDANAVDVLLLGPVSRGLAFEVPGEARNVSSIDEVPDSAWFTNRAAPPEALARGPCNDEPSPPFTVKTTKSGGTTPGFVARDSRGQKYVLKVDEIEPWQPEISTAADVVGSRLYWALGFNAPCNDVVYVRPSDVRLEVQSVEVRPTGERVPLTRARLDAALAEATPGRDGTVRLSASRYIDGQGVGTWRTEGVRKSDPNDVIPHEDRRELRGEYFLAGWLNHWDTRGPNTFDAFVEDRCGVGGHIVHYFLDFSDALGAFPTRAPFREARAGFETVTDVPTILVDAATFGLVRRPWDDVSVDPRAPNLGYFDVAHFEPTRFAPQTPVVRFARATPQDLAWMARKIARLGEGHVRAAVRAARLSDPLEEARLVSVLMGRRERILRASFARVSPLSDVALEGPDRLCATDLGVETGLSRPGLVSHSPAAERRGARVCVRAPRARGGGPDDSPSRYVTLDWTRAEGGRATVLRAHFYDLGARGLFLAGLERL